MKPIFVRRVLPSMILVALPVFGALLLTSSGYGDEAATQAQKPNEPSIAAASDEGERALQGFRIPEGMTGSLFAAEPMLANPVAFCIDEQGRFYVCETFRQGKGVEDNRHHMDWLHDDLAAQTVEDRLAYFKKHLGNKIQDYTREDDRIRLIEDTDGDGKADKATVFADRFNGILEGTGAGVLARGGDVYYTNIPNLWLLKDENGDGKADVRKLLSYGYGVRVAFRGHDSHGLVMGPDGRLYFSIGDRGYHIVTKEGKTLARPDTGAVFRCEPDGSHLEVFAYGLRNPQELAFDDYGNLFTADNNSDSGDKARWVHIVEGSDTGWRMYYQYLSDRGPWNRERIWHPYQSDDETKRVQPAYIVPPVANLGDGPSGLVAYPGVGLPEHYDGHFFLADFRGTPNNSGIRSFAVKPKGATFELTDSHEFLWSILATDVDFGYDGSMYVTDWVDGWTDPKKGRIYRFTHGEAVKEAVAAESAKLMKAGFAHRSIKDLIGLFSHPDRRVRMEAQFALAAKPRDDASSMVRDLMNAVLKRENRLVALHAVWAIGQMHRANRLGPDPTLLLAGCVVDDPMVRSQAILTLGDVMSRVGGDEDVEGGVNVIVIGTDEILIENLSHNDSRVSAAAAMVIGKLGFEEALQPLFALLERNADADPVLRHAAVMGLVGIGDHEALQRTINHSSRSVRLGAVIALRRIDPDLTSDFLRDADPAVALEAARAINDDQAIFKVPQLAALAGSPGLSDAMLRRVINANFRLGKSEHAAAVAKIAADASAPEAVRLEAIAALEAWSNPPPLDRVTGAWRPLKPRSAEFLKDAIRPALAGIFTGSDKVRQAGAKLAGTYGIEEVGPVLFELAGDAARDAAVRVEAIRALEALNDSRVRQAMELALAADAPPVRAEGRRLLVKLQPEKAVSALSEALATGSTVERQSAVVILESLKTPEADAVLAEWVARLASGSAPAEIQLELLDAAAKRTSPEFQLALTQFEAARRKDDHLAAYRESLAGGNLERGRDIFLGRSEVSCRRCHKIDGDGGEVGPDLSKIGAEKNREYLLEAIVSPNKQIAKGFETVVLAMEDGKVHIGIVKTDEGATLQLMTADGKIVQVAKDEIEDQAAGKSSMPEDLLKHLSKSDVRDLVEFLSTRKADGQAHGTAK